MKIIIAFVTLLLISVSVYGYDYVPEFVVQPTDSVQYRVVTDGVKGSIVSLTTTDNIRDTLGGSFITDTISVDETSDISVNWFFWYTGASRPKTFTEFYGAKNISTDGLTASSLAASAAAEIEDSVYANRADYMADISSLSTSAEVATATAKVDTVLLFGTLYPNSKYEIARNSDQDTVFFKVVNDTIGYSVFFHPGGNPGGPPDSVKHYRGAP